MQGNDPRAGGRDGYAPDNGQARSGDTLPPVQLVRPPGLSRKTLALGGLGLALVLVIAGIVALLNSGNGRGQHTTLATAATQTPDTSGSTTVGSGVTVTVTTPTPKGATATPHPTSGWVNAGPSFAMSIAFAPSDPAIAYVCGPNPAMPPSSNLQAQMVVGVTHDGGASWQVYGTPEVDTECGLSISSTNPQDVALLGDMHGVNCSPCRGKDAFISIDGGQHWLSRTLPLEQATQQVDTSIDAVAWMGNTLFATPHRDQDAPYPYVLAKSVNGNPFQWVSQHTLPSSPGFPTSIDRLFSQGAALYALVDDGACPTFCYYLARTTDGGATWTNTGETFFTYIQGWAGADGASLYALAARGDTPNDTIAVSRDAGKSWHTLPPLPGSILLGQSFVALPDGTIYCALNGIPASAGGESTPSGIYRLAPGAQTWTYIASLPTANWLLAVQWGTNGHALALWGQGNLDDARHVIGAGLQTHTP